jgi:hypothetical protein
VNLTIFVEVKVVNTAVPGVVAPILKLFKEPVAPELSCIVPVPVTATVKVLSAPDCI